MSDAPEVWASIPGAPSYEASDLGRVRRRGSAAGRVLRSFAQANGYLKISLSEGGVVTNWRVHRCVWFAFRGCVSSETDINHIDGDKSNNRLDNLELATRSENMAHASRMSLIGMGETHYGAVLTNADVLAIRAQAADGVPQRKIGLAFGVKQQAVSDIVRRKNWKHI